MKQTSNELHLLYSIQYLIDKSHKKLLTITKTELAHKNNYNADLIQLNEHLQKLIDLGRISIKKSLNTNEYKIKVLQKLTNDERKLIGKKIIVKHHNQKYYYDYILNVFENMAVQSKVIINNKSKFIIKHNLSNASFYNTVKLLEKKGKIKKIQNGYELLNNSTLTKTKLIEQKKSKIRNSNHTTRFYELYSLALIQDESVNGKIHLNNRKIFAQQHNIEYYAFIKSLITLRESKRISYNSNDHSFIILNGLTDDEYLELIKLDSNVVFKNIGKNNMTFNSQNIQNTNEQINFDELAINNIIDQLKVECKKLVSQSNKEITQNQINELLLDKEKMSKEILNLKTENEKLINLIKNYENRLIKLYNMIKGSNN